MSDFDYDYKKDKNGLGFKSSSKPQEDKKPVAEQQAEPEKEYSKLNAMMDNAPTRNKGFGGAIKDTALSLGVGAAGISEIPVGVADVFTGGKVGKYIDEKGLDFGQKVQQDLADRQSDRYKEQQQEFAEAGGDGSFGERVYEKAKYAVKNPSLVVNTVAQSIPDIVVGQKMAKAMPKGMSREMRGAAGEGITAAAHNIEDIRRETEDQELTGKQIAYGGATGLAVSLFGWGGNKLSTKLGIGDIDTMFLEGFGVDDIARNMATLPSKSVPKAIVHGAISEGFLEELPQEVSEQILSNLALDKEWSEGVDDSLVMGTLAGMLMGGSVGGTSAMVRRQGNNPDPEIEGFDDTPPPPNFDAGGFEGDAPIDGNGYTGFAPPPVDDQFRTETPRRPSEEAGLDPSKGFLSAAAALAYDQSHKLERKPYEGEYIPAGEQGQPSGLLGGVPDTYTIDPWGNVVDANGQPVQSQNNNSQLEYNPDRKPAPVYEVNPEGEAMPTSGEAAASRKERVDLSSLNREPQTPKQMRNIDIARNKWDSMTKEERIDAAINELGFDQKGAERLAERNFEYLGITEARSLVTNKSWLEGRSDAELAQSEAEESFRQDEVEGSLQQQDPTETAKNAWNSMSTIERNKVAAEALGRQGVLAKNTASKAWDNLSEEDRASLTESISEEIKGSWVDTNRVNVDTKAPVLQNRDRSTAEMINQMRSISTNPNYNRVSVGRDFGTGAPVVTQDSANIAPEQLGRQDIAVTATGKEIPVQYAVVEADQLLPSNNASGHPNKGYDVGVDGKMRAIAGNGRTAGIQAAWEKGKAEDYKQKMIADAESIGVDPNAIESMSRPVLVRIMPQEHVTNNIGDESNIPQQAGQTALEKSKNDMRRLDLTTLEFNENGEITTDTLISFIKEMPANEHSDLIVNGLPTQLASSRLKAAIFQQAYGQDHLTELQASSMDNEARTIISGLEQAAPSMAKLSDAGEYDFREAVAKAASVAVTARNKGVPLDQYLLQGDQEKRSEEVDAILNMMAKNNRSAKRTAEKLKSLATYAFDEASKSSTDMLGEVTKATPMQIIELAFEGKQADLTQSATSSEPQGETAQIKATPQGEAPKDSTDTGGEAWRNNYIQAAKKARELGIDPKKHKALADLNKAIDAATSNAQQQSESDSPTRPVGKDDGFSLSQQTEEELSRQDEERKEAEEKLAKEQAAGAKAERDAAEKAAVKQQMESANEEFTLGQDANENLSGQRNMMDFLDDTANEVEQAASQSQNTKSERQTGKSPAEANQAQQFEGPRQARMAADFAAGNWKTSDQPVNRGGVSPQEFADAIQNSDAYATLTPYTAKELKAGIKAGTMRLFQLGQDGQIFFMLETRPDGSVELASVVNNEQDAKGIGAPAVLLKAIEEGATNLTAFAVANEKYPAGFLPTLYESFGFDVTNSMEFDPRYFRDDLPKKERDLAIQDAVKYWADSTSGFNPDTGMPSVVEMKWGGNDADRANITERYFRGSLESLFAGRADANVQASEAQLVAPDQQATQEVGSAPDSGRATGTQGAGNRPPVPSRAKRVVEGIAELNDTELRNLGLTTADRDAARTATGSADARFSLRGSEQAGDRGGRYSIGELAPLEGAPTVEGAAGPDPRIVQVAESYARSVGINLRRQAEFVEVDATRARRIAAAYEAMPHAPQDPVVREAYENLIRQTVAQYRALERAGYKFWLFDESNDPYAGNPWNAMRDLRSSQSMGVFATESGFGSGDTEINVADNPLLEDTGIKWPYGSPEGKLKRVLANDLFRAVHDAFGHGMEGAGFRARGEENAWQAHARLFTGSAVGAITSETRGQNSWLNYGPHSERNQTAQVGDTIFADQKTGLMPEWTWAEGRVGDMPAEPRFSRNTNRSGGMTKAHAQNIANNLLGGNARQKNVYVVQNYEELPAEVKRDISKDGAADGDFNALHHKGKSYIIADAMTSQAAVEAAIFHEHYTHGGLRAKYGKDLAAKLDDMLFKSGGIVGVRMQAKKQGIDLSAYESALADNPNISAENKKRILMEELLAHMAHTTGTLRRRLEEVLGAIRQWLRDNGFAELAKLSASDIAYTLKQAREAQMEKDSASRSTFINTSNVNEREQAYETDLFGDPIPNAGRNNKRKEAKRGGRNVQPTSELRDTPAPDGEYIRRTILGVEKHKTIPVSKISSYGELATASRGLYDSAVEHFEAYVTDKNGKVLGVVGNFKGAISQASVYLDVVLFEALRLEGAKSIWFTHNHPSGNSDLSDADKRITRQFNSMLLGTGLDVQGIIAVGQDEYSAFSPNDRNIELDNFQKSVPDVSGKSSVPVIERQLERHSGRIQSVNSPFAGLKISEELYKQSGNKSGILFLDNQHYPVAYVPVTEAMKGILRRDNGGALSIYRAASESNASAAIIVHGGDLDREIGDTRTSIASNLASAITNIQMRALDIINVETGQSEAQTGSNIGVKAMLSRSQSAAPAVDTPAFKKWFGDSKVVDAEGKPLVVYHGTASDFSQFDTASLGDNTRAESGELGFFFTAKNFLSDSYAEIAARGGWGGKTQGGNPVAYPVYLSIKNPKQYETASEFYRDADAYKGRLNEWRAELEAQGFDGVIVRDDFEEVIAFRPSQIKSATGNNGDFDGTNPDIRFSRTTRAAERVMAQADEVVDRADKWLDKERSIPANWTDAQKKAASKFDTFSPRQPIASRINKIRQVSGDKLAQKLFDQFRPLKKLSDKAFMQAHLSRGTDGALEAIATLGVPYLKDGAIAVKTNDNGFIGSLSKLGDVEEVNKFLMWVAANRAESLMEEGRENLFDKDDIEAMKQFATKTLKNGKPRRIAYGEALKQLNEYNKAILDIAQEAGLVNAESRAGWESEFYIPFYRVMQEEDGSLSNKYGYDNGGLVRQEVIKRLKGGTENLGDPLENIMNNWSNMLAASMRNMASTESLEQAATLGISEELQRGGDTWTMTNGQRRYWNVHDPSVLEALEALNFNGYNNGVMKAAGSFKRALTIGVTISPTFRVRNLIRDTLHAMAVTDVGYNPLANAIDGWKLSGKGSESMAQLMAGGGAIRLGSFTDGQAGDYVKRTIKHGIKDSQILNTPEKFQRAIANFYKGYQELGDKSETVNRAVIYRNVLEKTGSHLEASFAARDVMNFTSMGSAAIVRAMAQVLPFFNARLQGMYKLGRGANENPQRFMGVIATIGMASSLLYLMQADDDEYKQMPDYVRQTYWPIKLGDTWVYIPKPFEVGAMASVIEHFTELVTTGGDYDAGDFKDSVVSLLINNLELNPVPQIIKPAAEAWYNYDMFRQMPIDSMAMERLLPADRFDSRTSAGAVAAGRVLNASPKKVEHLVRGYFGWLGTQALNVSDILGRGMMDMPSSTKWDMGQKNNWFIAGDFLKDKGTTPSKYTERFYAVQRDINQIYATANAARRVGDIDRYRELMDDPKMEARPMIASATNRIGIVNKQIRAINARKDLSAADKNERLKTLYQRREAIARSVDEKSRL